MNLCVTEVGRHWLVIGVLFNTQAVLGAAYLPMCLFHIFSNISSIRLSVYLIYLAFQDKGSLRVALDSLELTPPLLLSVSSSLCLSETRLALNSESLLPLPSACWD